MNDIKSLSHSKCRYKYHIIFALEMQIYRIYENKKRYWKNIKKTM